MALIIDPDLLNDGSTDNGSTEVFINTTSKTIKLNITGNLSNTGVQGDNGVTLKALYSFLKEEWRNDPNTKNLAAFSFPMVPITDESFEFVEGWDFVSDASRNLIRTAGWTVKNLAGAVTQKWSGIIGLGAIETNDQLYFQQDVGGAPTNVQLTGQVNQAVNTYSDPNGDGNTADGFDRRTVFNLFVREYNQIYGRASLSDIGVTTLDSIAYRFPISTSADLNIKDTDAKVEMAVAITSASWVTNTLTVNTTAVHGLTTGDFVSITGATPVAYNARGIVTVTDTDTFTMTLSSNPGSYTSGGVVGSVYSLIKARFFDQVYTKDVDSTTDRSFGIVIDVGTHSGVDGASSASGNTLTSAEGSITGANYTGGTLVVHEGANQGTYTVSATPTATVVTITTTFPSTVANQSFTLYPATALPVTAEQIYTAIQYQQRQNADMDATDQSVIGKTADQLLTFIGSDLKAGAIVSRTNPNGGGTGVIIEGFSASDTNRIAFYDNTSVSRTFPYVAALQINIGDNLKNDASAKYWIFFSALPGAGNDYGESGALIVDDNSGADIAGTIGGVSTITRTFNYDGNVQGGRTAGTDALITAVAIGLTTGQYVKATGTISRSTANSISLVSALERNYSNT